MFYIKKLAQASLLALVAAVVSIHAPASNAFQCSDVFRNQPIGRVGIARELLRQGSLGIGTYVSRWNVRNPEHAGPYAMSGEMMVTSVKNENYAEWMQAVGTRSIGLMVTRLPMANPRTGGLRVGNTFYSYQDIQSGAPGRPMASDFSTRGLTEATFTVSPNEMRAIEEFLRDRGAGQILAQRDIRGGPRAGQPIRPDFNKDKGTLTAESCAAAACSFVNPAWLELYQSPNADILRALGERLSIETTAVGKHFIWRNARNPNAIAITLFGHESTPEDFIRENQWGPLRGLPVYGFMPDPVSGQTGTIQSERVTLEEWFRAQGR